MSGNTTIQHLGAIQLIVEQLRQISSRQQQQQQSGQRTEQCPIQIEQLIGDLDEYGRYAARNAETLDIAFGEREPQRSRQVAGSNRIVAG
jgi:hypothetical protein